MSTPHVALIAAVATNGVIGRNNVLPWRLSDDLKRFKALTMDNPIVMGRKTWDSLGRPLPGRHNIVVSRQRDLRLEGATVAASLDEALRCAGDVAQVFVIGGAQLYVAAMPRADRLFITEVHADVAGDAHFPPIEGFREITRESHTADERNEYDFDFVEYVREPSR